MTVPNFTLGESIPPDTAHAVSVSLPTWSANVGYEEGEAWVVDSMTTGYPRFFIHKSICALADVIVARFAIGDSSCLKALLLPSPSSAQRCFDFIRRRIPDAQLQVVSLVPRPARTDSAGSAALSAVICSTNGFSVAKQYWQHTGDGISSRRAEVCSRLLAEGHLVEDSRSNTPTSLSGTSTPVPGDSPAKFCKGPKRYQRQSQSQPCRLSQPSNGATPMSPGGTTDESSRFLEERFGRNLDITLVQRAKSAIKRRIAGVLRSEVDLDKADDDPLPGMEVNSRGIQNLREDDIYLFPCGMNAIFNAHRALLLARGQLRSVNFGFPYVDTLKILEKFGPGCLFYGHASSADLDALEAVLKGGEKLLALFCEFPGNPLLTCPDMVRIRSLADTYGFAVVVDETIGTFANINVLQYSDVVVSSLTKIFSGDCNVMGGSAILNPNSQYYTLLKTAMSTVFEDTYWPEDIIFMERNSRNFVSRIERINTNAEAICETLRSSPLVKRIYYPKYNDTRANYENCKLPGRGYGGLLSVTFQSEEQAIAFYDGLNTAKGPSLGTNFTLTSPYVLLAHYQELDWAKGYGVDADLIRISVGLEDTPRLVGVVKTALEAAGKKLP